MKVTENNICNPLDLSKYIVTYHVIYYEYNMRVYVHIQRNVKIQQ